MNSSKKIYRTLWRWHFYAGVFAIPFVIILSITGALYLFKPQLDAIHDAPYRNLHITGTSSTPEQQVAVALASVPGAKFTAYELAREKTDAVNILVNKAGEKIRIYVHPQTLAVLAIENEDTRFLRIVHDIHGELLLGKIGSVLVELAACWAIVLVLTGLYLWWPRDANGLAGILYPRFALKGRLFWRDLHSVMGIWISCLVLFLLISGLPWALVWGSALKELRSLGNATASQQDWVIAGRTVAVSRDEHDGHQQSSHEGHNLMPIIKTDEHAHHHGGDMATFNPLQKIVSLNSIVASAEQLYFVHPVLIAPPSANSANWSVKSNAQNRPQRADAYFSAQTGELVEYQTFAQRKIIDRVIGIGVAAHEGQLFGWLNQLLGLLTAVGLVVVSVSGFLMWRKRAPAGSLGAPPAIPDTKIGIGFVAIILTAAILLPVLGVSLVVILIMEKIIFSRWASARQWLGLQD